MSRAKSILARSPLPYQRQGLILNRSSPLARDLVGWFDCRGLHAIDLTGNVPQIAADNSSGDVSYLGSDLGHSTNFTGDNTNDRLNLGSIASNHPLALAGQARYTFAAWLRKDLVGNFTGADRVFQKATGAVAANGYGVFGENGGEILRFRVGGTNADTGTLNIDDGKFHLVCFVREGAGTNESFWYIDGVLSNQTTQGEEIPTATADAAIGNWTHATGRMWVGPIATVGVWQRALDLGEVQRLYDPATRWELYWQPKLMVPGFVAAAGATTFTKTTSLDALLQKSYSVTTSLDASLQKGATLTASFDAVLQKASTTTAALDANLQKTYTVTSSLDAVFSRTSTVTASLDAALQKTYTPTASLDGALQKTYTTTASLDAVLISPSAIVPVIESVTNSSQTTEATSLVVAMPASRPDGDLYIIVATKDGSTAFTPPAGWTEIFSVNATANRVMGWYRIGSSEPATYTFTMDSQQALGSVYRISSFDAASPINVSGSSSGTSETAIAPDVTTTVGNTLALRIAGKDGGLSISTIPGTTDFDESTGGGTGTVAQAGGHADGPASAGTTGTANFTWAGTQEWGTATIAVAPASAVTTSMDGILVRDVVDNVDLDALLQKTYTPTCSLDALLVRSTILCDLDAILSKATLVTTDLDAALLRMVTATTSLDGIVQRVGTLLTTGLDGKIQSPDISLTTGLDSVLTKITLPTVSLDAQLIRISPTTISMDAILALQGETISVSLDALLYQDWDQSDDAPGAVWTRAPDWGE